MNESMDRVVADWLHEGPERGPREGLERALAATRRVGQRPGWTLPERWLPVQLTMTRTRAQRPIFAVVLLALLTVALVATALYIGSQRRELPPPLFRNGAVVYAADGDLFIADQLGGTSRPLVAGPDADSNPVFSPQGDRLAFVRESPNWLSSQIMTVRLDGSDIKELTTVAGWGVHLAWAPDGSSLMASALSARCECTWEHHIIETDGSGKRLIDAATETASGPAAWRPGGRQIGYLGWREDTLTAYVADANETNVRRSAIGPTRPPTEWEGLESQGLDWSPSGRSLAFTSGHSDDVGQVSIVDIDEDGALTDVRQVKLDPESAAVSAPSWSPDGSRLAVVVMRDAALRVAIVNEDGSGYRLVGPEVDDRRAISLNWPDLEQPAIDLTWAPDGRSVVISEHRFGPHSRPDDPLPPAKAWSVDADSGAQTEIDTPVHSWQQRSP
jgi:dipeptidyl aminopeptidase/acylaminoacyl peptidase